MEKVIQTLSGITRIKLTTEEEKEYLKSSEADQPIGEPTQLDRIEAQVLYTALMTDTLIEE